MTFDSNECQDVESICSGKLSHVPSQPAVVPGPRAVSSRDQSLRPDAWNLSETRKCFWQSTCSNRLITDTLPSNQRATGGNPCETVQRDLLRKVKNNVEAQFHCRVLQEDHQSLILSFQQKDHRIIWVISKDCKSRSFILINSPHLQRIHVGR